MTKRASRIACLIIAGIALVGCTANVEKKEPEEATPSAPAAVVENDFTVQPGTSDDDFVGAVSDVTTTTCDSGEDGTKIAGTVTNPTETAADYRIYVSLMSEEDTLGIVQIDVAALGGGETTDWSKDAAAGAPKASCVLRVERSVTE